MPVLGTKLHVPTPRRELHAVRESLHRSGQWLDTVAYALLHEEWEAGAR